MPRFKLVHALSLLFLAASQAAAQADVLLPTYLTNMERQTTVDINGMQAWTEPHGFDCFNWELFTYQNATSATTAVNVWVTQNGLTTQTVATEPGLIQWKASNGQADIYAVWQSGQDAGGRLWMCKGTDREAALARQAAAQAQARPAPTDLTPREPVEPSGPRIRIPLWAVLLLGGGVAGGISRSIARNPFDPRNDRGDDE